MSLKILEKLLRLIRLFLNLLQIYRPLLNKIRRDRVKKFEKKRKVTFLVYQSAVWKSDGVYKLLDSMHDVEVSVTILPIISNNRILNDDLDRTLKYFKDKNLNTNVVYKDRNFFNAVKYFKNVDTIVFSDCWNLSNSILYYYLFLTKDCVYVPYSHQVSKYDNYQSQYNQLIHNFVRSIYAPHEYEYEIYDSSSYTKNDNVKFFGYPGVVKIIEGFDIEFSGDGSVSSIFPNNPWSRLPNKQAKKLIWAPHHSINWKNRKYSNFLEMHDLMINYANTYSDKVNFAFKPHPMLKEILYEKWGKQKTNNYFSEWEHRSNCIIEEGDYSSLFFFSDALIHDCGSFLAEYTYLDKPHIFIKSSENIFESFNKFGVSCLENITTMSVGDDLDKFMGDFVSDNLAELNNQRKDYSKFLRDQSRFSEKTIASDILLREIN